MGAQRVGVEAEVAGEPAEVQQRAGRRRECLEQSADVGLVVDAGEAAQVAFDDRVDVALEEPDAPGLGTLLDGGVSAGGDPSGIGGPADRTVGHRWEASPEERGK